MIKFTATNAQVHYVTPVIEVPSKTGGQGFFKRELIINDSWEKDGKQYPNFVSVEFSGEKMSQLEGIYPGQRVNIEGMLCGREYNNKIYNSVRGLSVTPYQPQQQYPGAPAPVPAGYPQQASYPQQPPYQSAPMPGGYPQQPPVPGYPQQQYTSPTAPVPPRVQAPLPPTPHPQQAYGQQYSPGADDLPFDH